MADQGGTAADAAKKAIKKAGKGGNYNRDSKKSVLNPAPGFNFALQVEAAFFVPLRSVRVFTKENEFDYYQEGGLNDYVHMLRKPISKPFTFQVERYVAVSSGLGLVDPLSLGTDLILPLILYVNRQPRESWDSISFTNCARAYVFTGCTVISKEFGELNSEQSKLATETTTISYREMFIMNQVDPSLESGEPWNIKDDSNSHPENRQSGESRKKLDQQARDSMWAMSKEMPAGNNKFHTRDKMSKDGKPQGTVTGNSQNRKTGDELGKSERWVFDGSLSGKGKAHTQNRNVGVKPEVIKYPPTKRAHQAESAKPEVVKYPPTKRALKADALAKK